MLMTAKYNFRNYTTWAVLDTSQRTIANLLKTKGYITCAAGKWQFNGGDSSIRAFGFDRYLVTNPYKTSVEENLGIIKFYKNPEIYENGAYWPDNKVRGKYGEDIVRDYMFSFIDSVKGKKPFFIYWAPNLVHDPYCPTPDDPEFASWTPNRKAIPADTAFFPSMVKYHDKLIGQLLTKLQNSNIAGKTLIFWLGDNGTSKDIHSLWNGQVAQGGKANSSDGGTHVPMLAYMPGKIAPGVDTNMISLVDFMSTIGTVAGATIPASYGTTDGISFCNQLFGGNANARPWVFCHFIGSGKFEADLMYLRRWMQYKNYKQYDSAPNKRFAGKFFNIVTDPAEQSAIKKSKMTTQEKKISNQLFRNMVQLHLMLMLYMPSTSFSLA